MQSKGQNEEKLQTNRSAQLKKSVDVLSWLFISLLHPPLKCIIISLLCLTTTTTTTLPRPSWRSCLASFAKAKLCCELSLCNICLSVIFSMLAFFSSHPLFESTSLSAVCRCCSSGKHSRTKKKEKQRFFSLSIKLNLTMRAERASVDATGR
jgi:hypothetical protein